MACIYPHCTCLGKCVFGGNIPRRDRRKPLFKREQLKALAERHELASALDHAPGFHLSNDDMKAIAFALRFTAMRL